MSYFRSMLIVLRYFSSLLIFRKLFLRKLLRIREFLLVIGLVNYFLPQSLKVECTLLFSEESILPQCLCEQGETYACAVRVPVLRNSQRSHNAIYTSGFAANVSTVIQTQNPRHGLCNVPFISTAYFPA